MMREGLGGRFQRSRRIEDRDAAFFDGVGGVGVYGV